jgi:hypothetical protein
MSHWIAAIVALVWCLAFPFWFEAQFQHPAANPVEVQQ